MLVWIIVIVLLLLILACPVGIDAAYTQDARHLKLKIGPFRKQLLPAEKKKKPQKPPEAGKQEEKSREEKKKRKITPDDILTLAEIALDTLHAFRMHLTVDRFLLHWTAAAKDPYDAVQQYGRINAVLGIMAGKAHASLTIRDEDIQAQLDLTREKPLIEVCLILSIQIWEILWIGLCAGAKGLRWLMNKKRNERAAAAAASERSISDGEL